jgi:ceramide glucosyltransferase
MHLWLTLFAMLCAPLALLGAAYYAICIWASRRFLRENASLRRQNFTPPVSLLKSLKGVDPHMYTAFRSHCVLDYPQYEVLFGVNDLNDAAVELVQRLQREFPNVALRIIHCPEVLGTNGKVSTLAQMIPKAQYEHVLINDSDIVVPPDFLSRVVHHFADDRVGMVTTLYRAIAGKTLGSKLEALGISADFMGGVLVAREMEGGIHFALGATMATTKSALAKIGGLESIVEYLGDDYELGVRISAAGYQVRLADVVVETALPDYNFRSFWVHQLRWARNVKDRRKSQYCGLIVTFGLVWAVLGVVAAPRVWWTWAVLAITSLIRFGAALGIGRDVLSDPQLPGDLWLVPVRDFVALAVWIASFFGNTVEWRGMRFRLKDGKLMPIR